MKPERSHTFYRILFLTSDSFLARDLPSSKIILDGILLITSKDVPPFASILARSVMISSVSWDVFILIG